MVIAMHRQVLEPFASTWLEGVDEKTKSWSICDDSWCNEQRHACRTPQHKSFDKLDNKAFSNRANSRASLMVGRFSRT